MRLPISILRSALTMRGLSSFLMTSSSLSSRSFCAGSSAKLQDLRAVAAANREDDRRP